MPGSSFASIDTCGFYWRYTARIADGKPSISSLIALSADKKTLWVANTDANSIRAVNATTLVDPTNAGSSSKPVSFSSSGS